MARPDVLSLDELAAALRAQPGEAYLWSLPRFAARAQQRLSVPAVPSLDDLPEKARVLIVLGGGARIDEAKLWRRDVRPGLRLIAIPSLWGSGAEASPVVALDRDGKKRIELDDALLPDARCVWPELAEDLPEWRAREACGDAWSHAVEGFLSPLGGEGLRAEIAQLLRSMIALPLGRDAAWFEASAAACAAQARAGVGLVHGIAHAIEGPLARDLRPDERAFGHARLCSLFLAPVLALNRELSPKFDDFTAAHGVDGAAVLAVADALFDRTSYRRTLGVLEANWRSVLLDPCSRTNSALVRPQHLTFFTEERFR